MKKAFDQTVRDLKRGVNKKVLKVPSIEQKVLDATSNEPWGPHGSLLADIAQATRNYHEYQMIMSVIWKRINDTGKNWRHVYKALTVLEYLVAHGSERVIDDIREHVYQIATLSDFQYIDSRGKDQGNNVRKKSQTLVVLVNDKERIQEARQKAAANRDKYRNTPMGGMYRPGSGSYGDKYDDDRSEGRYGYGSRDDDRNGYGREREWGSRDDDRYGRYGESYGRDGDRYGRDSDEGYDRDGYRDDDHRGRSQSTGDYNYGSRSRSADRDRNPANEDDSHFSSRGSGVKADDQYQDGSSAGKTLDRKYSDQSYGAPPSYEDVVVAARSPHNERDGETSVAYARKASSSAAASPSHVTTSTAPAPAPPPVTASTSSPSSAQSAQNINEVDRFDEFDPRGSFSASPATSYGIAPAASAVEMDLLGSLSESFSSNSMALVPATQPDVASEVNTSASFNSGPTMADPSSASANNNQPFGDPFGDGPFRAIPTTDSTPVNHQFSTSTNSFTTNSTYTLNVPQPPPQNTPTEFGGPFGETTYMPSGPSGGPTNIQFPHEELSPANPDIDILANILPPPAVSSFANTQGGYPVAPSQPVSHGGFPPQTNEHELQPGLSSLGGTNVPQNSFQAQTGQPGGYPLQSAGSISQTGFPTQTMTSTFPVQSGQASQMGFHPQISSAPPNPSFYGTYHSQPPSTSPTPSYMVPTGSTRPNVQHGFPNSGPSVSMSSHMGPQAPHVLTNTVVITQASTGSSAVVPKSSSDKFETKSTVWTDTLSRGLVNLNISGSKTNPLNDIGVDFDAINRKEKRMEKQTTATVTSTVTMGKAMGSGSGMGRAAASSLRSAPNPMMGSGMNFGMAGGPGGGMSMGGYGGSQPMGRGMSMGMNMPGAMGMGPGMNMQQPMGPGMNMQRPGSIMSGGYNPTMGTGNYGQQPYGGGYR